MYSSEVTTKFAPNYGIGLPFTNIDGEECISIGKTPQKAWMEVRTWVGTMAIGAVHYYCSIDIRGKGYKIISTEEETWTCGHGDKCKPQEMMDLEIQIVRKVTAKDRKWERQNGELPFYMKGRDAVTRGFWTEKEAFDAGVEFFKKWFDGWILEGHNEEGNIITLAQT